MNRVDYTAHASTTVQRKFTLLSVHSLTLCAAVMNSLNVNHSATESDFPFFTLFLWLGRCSSFVVPGLRSLQRRVTMPTAKPGILPT